MTSKTMRRIRLFCFGIDLAIAAALVLAIARVGSAHAQEVRLGTGRTYAILGDLPVKHRGRVKPLNSVSIAEVKLIHGGSAIKLKGPDGKTTLCWEPVAALLDWSARPEFWDDQHFILVEYLPLKRLLLGASVRAQIRSLAGLEMPEVRRLLQALAAQPELTDADLRTAAREVGEASAMGKSLNALASKVGEDSKWLSPRVLEDAQLELEGRTLTFEHWVGEILDKKDRARSGGMWATPSLTPIEENATVVGERYFHYKAIRDHNGPALEPLDLLVIPRPPDEIHERYSAECFKKGMKPKETLSPLEANVADTLMEYLQGIQNKDRALPGEDGAFDQKFSVWLYRESPWIPLGIILDSDDSELSRASFPLEQVAAFRKSYRDFEDAERAAPGNAPEAVAVALIAAARDLATSAGLYPEPDEMARESYFNRIAPFSKAPLAYGFGLALLLLSLGITSHLRTAAGKLGAALYCLGMAGLMAGIALELYGILLGFRVYGRIPITNIYQTVIWVGLATSVLGVALELLWRKKYAALAAGGIGLLATLLAENVSVLDPSILTVLPVEQVNRWLLCHVLTIVSSYAAFALALGLGLLAVGHYLTASYRRAPSYRELAWPLLLGIPPYVLGRIGIDDSYQLVTQPVLDLLWLYYAGSGLAVLGGVLTIVGGFSLLGELANRSPRRAGVVGVILAAVGSTGLIAGETGLVPGPWARALTSYDAWLIDLAGGLLIVMSLLGSRSREAFTRIELLANLIYRAMQVGIVLLAAGTIAGGAWAYYTWSGFWGWDPKLVLALFTLLVYLVPLLGRFAGWLSTFGLVAASVLCFMAVLISWYGMNFVLRVGLHNYGFTERADRKIMMACTLAVLALVGAAAWRRSRSQ
jgi:ABC-type transport system involved in cytochrome c biogenesis permease subunit